MRKLFSYFVLILLPAFATSQTFLKAPKESIPIRQITEWTTFAGEDGQPEETIKDGVYLFRQDGLLEKWVSNNAHDEVFSYRYDEKKRLTEVAISEGKRTRKMSYQYFDDRRMAEIQEWDMDVRSTQYFNKKGKITEEKSFWRSKTANAEWTTLARTVFNYNNLDSLAGEMRYEPAADGTSKQYKTLHAYEPGSHRKTAVQHFGPDGKLSKKTEYEYDSQGRVTKEKTINGSGKSTVTERIYKDGKLWQMNTKGPDFRIERIYKDGRLVRSKEYDKSDKMLWYTDYQYVTY